MTQDGQRSRALELYGQTEIRDSLGSIFEDHPTAMYVAKVEEVRALGADTILIRAVAGLVPPGKSELNPATNAIQSVVIVGSEREAKIALFQNTPAAFHGRPELSERLTAELTDVFRAGHILDAG